jgi:hypothetical protein
MNLRIKFLNEESFILWIQEENTKHSIKMPFIMQTLYDELDKIKELETKTPSEISNDIKIKKYWMQFGFKATKITAMIQGQILDLMKIISIFNCYVRTLKKSVYTGDTKMILRIPRILPKEQMFYYNIYLFLLENSIFYSNNLVYEFTPEQMQLYLEHALLLLDWDMKTLQDLAKKWDKFAKKIYIKIFNTQMN